MKITAVVLAHYPEFVERSVRSAMNFDEILVMHDFTPDTKYVDLLENPKIRWIKSPVDLQGKMSLSKSEAANEIISFLDGDDEFLPSKYNFLQKTYDGGYINDMSSINFSKRVEDIKVRDIGRIIRTHSDWHISGITIEKDCISELGPRSLDKILFFDALNCRSDLMIRLSRTHHTMKYENKGGQSRRPDLYYLTFKTFRDLDGKSKNMIAGMYAFIQLQNNAFLSKSCAEYPGRSKSVGNAFRIFFKTGYFEIMYSMLKSII